MEINQFYADKEMVGVVKQYLFDFIANQVVERTFKDGTMNAEAMFEAKEVIKLAFENLDALYGPKSKPEKVNNTSSR